MIIEKNNNRRAGILQGFFAVLAAFLFLSCASGGNRLKPVQGASVPLVTFVFDDGDDTDYLVGREVFAEQGVVACSAITTDWINTPDHLSTAQIIALRDAGWEIMSHTASHPNLKSLTLKELDDELARSKSVLEEMGLTINNIVYPFNKNNETVRMVAARYYRSGRGGTNAVNNDTIDPYFLKSFSLKHDLSLMKQYIDQAYASKSWIIFYQHEIDAHVKLDAKKGTFQKGELVRLRPSGTIGRYVTVHWFPLYGFSLYFVPLSGVPQPGDTITGMTSGATASIDSLIYNDRILLSDMINYIKSSYPDMRIVTIDQGLDVLGIPKKHFQN
ncbi:MAG: polysaccharide deacetylase family protein [Nitrospirota bacterium]